MKKILIKLENIDEYIKDNKFLKNKNMILTPLIKDYLTKEKIEIIYENEKCAMNVESLCKEMIIKILEGNDKSKRLEQVEEIIKKIKGL